MIKTDLITEIAQEAGLTQKLAEASVNLIFDKMTSTLIHGGRIEIRGFGSIVNRNYKSYVGRNPRTGEPVKVASKSVPFFKTGKDLKKQMNLHRSKKAKRS